jgi:hypothetical protein
MIPMFMLAPYAEVSEQHITRVARRRRDALLGELRVLAWARPAAGDDRAQARGHRGVPSLRWITRSLDHPTPTTHDVVRAVVRGTRRQLGIALVEIVAARAQPALRATSPAISLRAGFATALTPIQKPIRSDRKLDVVFVSRARPQRRRQRPIGEL